MSFRFRDSDLDGQRAPVMGSREPHTIRIATSAKATFPSFLCKMLVTWVAVGHCPQNVGHSIRDQSTDLGLDRSQTHAI